MTDIYDALKSDLLSRLPPGAGVRFSHREGSLFVTDISRRVPSASPPGAPWRTLEEGGLWFCRPEAALIRQLCPDEDPSFASPAGPAGRFAALLYRFREEGEADGDFTLSLLRALGRARTGQRSAALLLPPKHAYARGLAAGKCLRTRETALIALETARILEGGN